MKVPTLSGDLFDLLLPRGCLGCGGRITPEEPEELVCPRCRTLLRPSPPPRCLRCDLPLGTGHLGGEGCLECAQWPLSLTTARGAVVMEAPADALVHALKYRGWRSLGSLMGRRMAAVCPLVGRDAILVPVPTTSYRRRIRGYNQAHVLAEAVGRELGMEVVDALDRPRGSSQVRLGPRERLSNVQGSFRVSPSMCSRIQGLEVILIDDVMTTGATALSAASALQEKGATTVHSLTFARALPFGADQRNGPRRA